LVFSEGEYLLSLFFFIPVCPPAEEGGDRSSLRQATQSNGEDNAATTKSQFTIGFINLVG